MQITTDKLVTLFKAANEQEAALIEAALTNQGINSRSIGQFTADFRAEAPGSVRVLVFEGDFERSRQILQELGCAEPASDPIAHAVGADSPHSVSAWKMIVQLVIILWLALIGVTIAWPAIRAILR